MGEDVSPEGARNKALSYLTRREHSAREVEGYLLRKGYDGDTASSVTGSLLKSGLIDDGRLAELILRGAPGRGWGRSRARQELLRRGIDKDMAEESLRRLYPEEDISLALSLARKKWPACKGDDRRRRSSLAGYLARRGFSSSTVVKVLSELREDGAEDDGAG
jgi:regulatory protein